MSKDICVHDVIQQLAETHRPEGEDYGIVDFYYADLTTKGGGPFKHDSDISNLLNRLSKEGLVTRVYRGSAVRPSRWNVKNFLEGHPEIEFNAVKDKVAAPVEVTNTVPVEVINTDQAEVSLSDVSTTVKEMIHYMESSQKEMVSYLQSMMDKMAFGDPEIVKQLQENLMNVTVERDTAVNSYKEVLDSKQEINKHMIYRLRNAILDDMERYIITPGWEKNSKVDHFRKVVTDNLDLIMDEVGVGKE